MNKSTLEELQEIYALTAVGEYECQVISLFKSKLDAINADIDKIMREDIEFQEKYIVLEKLIPGFEQWGHEVNTMYFEYDYEESELMLTNKPEGIVDDIEQPISAAFHGY